MKRRSNDLLMVPAKKLRRVGPMVQAVAPVSEAKEALRKVNKLIREVESKAVDTTFSSAADITGDALLLSPIASGTDRDERVGDSVTPTKIEIGFVGTSTSGPNVFRVIIVQSNRSYTAGEGFGSSTPWVFAGQTTRVLSPINFENRKEFTILSDRYYEVQNYASSGTDGIVADRYVLFPKKKINFPGSGLIAASQGAIYALVVSDELSASPDATFTLDSRVWFRDS